MRKTGTTDRHDHGDSRRRNNDLGHRMKDGIHYGVTQIGDVEGGKGIFEVRRGTRIIRIRPKSQSGSATKDGKELENARRVEWRADELLRLPVRVPEDLPGHSCLC